MYKHLTIISIVALSIYLAAIQRHPGIVSQPDDHLYIYTTDDGARAWRCFLTEATDSCFLIDSQVGGYR